MIDKTARKKILLKLITAVLAIALVCVMPHIVKAVKTESRYNEAIRLIKKGEYEMGANRLMGMSDYKYSDALINYGLYMVRKDTSFFVAYDNICEIPTDYDGPFADEIASEREYAESVYDEKSIIYEQEEKERQKEWDEYREEIRASYADKLPKVGMNRDFVKDTLLGDYDKYSESKTYENTAVVPLYRYEWYSDDKTALVFVAEFRYDKCISAEKVNTYSYWDGDTPKFGGKHHHSSYTTSRYDDYDVFEYDDPEDFYYENYDDFEDYDDAEEYYDEQWGY